MSGSFENQDQSNSLFRVGDVVGNDYELLRELGRGGMGVVFEARHRFIDQPVALKVLYPHLLTEENWQRFVREARALGRLDHPGIVKIYNCGIDSRRAAPFYVMEVLKGDSLSDLLTERGYLEEAFAVRAALEAALALHFAHGMGVVHRDVKPSNFFLPSGEKKNNLNLKVLDFGIAALSSDRLSSKERQKLTATGQIFGTPYYMSPEVVTGQGACPLSDVYSLGCTLFELLTGRVPYKGASVFETLGMHMSAPLPSLAEVSGRDFSEELELLVAKAMAKSPNERYASMQMFAVDLERYLAHRPVYGAGIKSSGFSEIKQPTGSREVQVTDWSKAKRLSVVLALLCLGLSVLALYNSTRPPQSMPRATSSAEAGASQFQTAGLPEQVEQAFERRSPKKRSISPEDLRLIKSGYERGSTADAINYQFPSVCIGEIITPNARQPAQGAQIVPFKKNGKHDFVFFENVDSKYLGGLKPNSFDLDLLFSDAAAFAPTVSELAERHWQSLKRIRLDGITIDEGIKKLDQLPSCSELCLRNTLLAYPLVEFAQFSNAKVIVFKNAHGPQLKASLRALPKLQKLRSLQLVNLSLSDDDLDCLARTEQLNSLTIEESKVSALHLAKIMGLPHLDNLIIKDSLYEPSEILAALKNCPNRRILKLSLTDPRLSEETKGEIPPQLADRESLLPWPAEDIAAIRQRVGKFEVLKRRSFFDSTKGRFIPLSVQ
jgi:serine/threonine protein kinase